MAKTKNAKKTKKMRLGKVVFNIEYVVDLDNPDMIQHAKDCIYEDLMNAYKNDEVANWIEVQGEDKTLTKNDIPEFLLEK